jgi:menaquinone-specific isochorismate synthase
MAIDAQVRELPAPISLRVLKKTFFPAKENWIKNVETILDLVRQKVVQKVLLARICILQLESAPDPFAIAAALQQKAQNAHIFCLQSGDESFLGATPEQLFTRKGEQINSEALAGTRRRGQTVLEDEKLMQELLGSEKDIREFSFVKEHLAQILPNPVFTPTTVRKTQNVQHLYSSCTATLTEPLSDLALIARLHPTPALCGTPQKTALATIAQLEPFERGLYGGVIGWTTPEASDWVVAIRSCLLRGKTAILFSGTGIVKGSDPEAEWDELNQKLKLYDGILDH